MARSAGRERERTVCESCELPYYADGEGCPYCDDATTTEEPVANEESDGESGFVFGDSDSGESSPARGDRDGGDGLVDHLRRALGL